MEHSHGYLADSTNWDTPVLTLHSDKQARPGYNSVLAHEYQDTKPTLKHKINLLASMIRSSRYTTLYTGAGISTASGIPDYATKSDKPPPKLTSPYEAQPTYTHRALTALYRAGYVAHWIQQNHDGLPQKAGFPQHKMNEIHGAWFDPSNPVVPMSGFLRDDLFERLREWEEKADLVLALGTSLSGMNADRVVTATSDRAKKSGELGVVIVSVQCTSQDDKAALRIFGKVDEVFELLMEEMQLEVKESIEWKDESGDVFEVDGKVLDLREGRVVKIVGGVYDGDMGQVLTKSKEGHYKIRFMHVLNKKTGARAPLVQYLGKWMVDMAIQGLGKSVVESVDAAEVPLGYFPDD